MLAIWCEEPTHWRRLWCWERLKAGGEGYHREWDGWMASPSQSTWVWASSGSRWCTGRLGMLQSIGSQRVIGHDWALNWTVLKGNQIFFFFFFFLDSNVLRAPCYKQKDPTSHFCINEGWLGRKAPLSIKMAFFSSPCKCGEGTLDFDQRHKILNSGWIT